MHDKFEKLCERSNRKRVKSSILVDEDLLGKFRGHCQQQGYVMSRIIEKLIERYLEEKLETSE